MGWRAADPRPFVTNSEPTGADDGQEISLAAWLRALVDGGTSLCLGLAALGEVLGVKERAELLIEHGGDARSSANCAAGIYRAVSSPARAGAMISMVGKCVRYLGTSRVSSR